MVDLHRQYLGIRDEVERAMGEVIAQSAFIKGPAVGLFEQELAQWLKVRHCIACGNGTDALLLSLLAVGLQRGDEVIVPMKGEDMNDQPEGVKCYDWFFCTRPLPKAEIEKKLGKGYEIKG